MSCQTLRPSKKNDRRLPVRVPFRRCFSLIFAWVLLLPTFGSAYEYHVAIAAIFQDEAPYIREWIEFHKLLGVEYFILYNNHSSDHYMDVLLPYLEANEVCLIDWPGAPSTHDEWRQIQKGAYEDALEQMQGRCKWLAFIDLDEFLVLMHSDSLPNFLEEFDDYGAVTFNWQVFGTSGVYELREHEVMLEKLVYKTSIQNKANWFIKSIVRPERVLGVGDAHYCVYREPFYAVDINHRQPFRSHNSRIPIDRARINHYTHRTEKYFYEIKVPRKNRYLDEKINKTPKEMREYLNSYNQIYDDSALRFIDKLKSELFSN